ncbi:MAG: hypothetical protein ACRC46_11070 [Thermoguttaceae bacterium]
MRIIGSLYVALVLMAVLAGVLVWGTFVEATYGTPTARFVLYDSLPFTVLLGLVAVNVSAAMVVRLRFWRKQLPFFAAHAGILLVLVGSFVTQRFGEEATLALFEGETGQIGQKASSCLAIRSLSIDAPPADTTQLVAFAPGPQNWFAVMRGEGLGVRDGNTLAPSVRLAAAWQQQIAKQTSFRGDGVTVEVLDYLAATTVTEVPPLELAVRWERPLATSDPQNTTDNKSRAWETLQMAVRPRQSHPSMPAMIVTARGTREATQGKERVTFTVAESFAEVAAFRDVTEVTPRGAGVCKLWCRGETITLDVAKTVAEFANGATSVALGSHGFKIEKFQWIERLPMVTLEVVAPSGVRATLRLFADAPERNIVANDLGVCGSYWINPNDESLASRNEPTYAMLSQPRLDLLQSPNGKLFWRYWNGSSLVDAGQVVLTAGVRDTFKSQTISVAATTPNAMSFAVNKFVPCDFAGGIFRAAPVSRETSGLSTARVKLRLTVDGGESEECWLREFVNATGLAPERDQIARLYPTGRTVSVIFTGDVVDLGFALRLDKFTQQNEPGTRMAAGFTSLVDEITPQQNPPLISVWGERRPQTDADVLRKDVVIRMNHPGTFRSVKTGRTYRVYQASRSGPFRSGDGGFEQLYDGELFSGETTPREEIWRSVLSVNYDPGRGIKYLGCFLLIVGLGLFAFRRARSVQ